jgi:hypothetical protein
MVFQWVVRWIVAVVVVVEAYVVDIVSVVGFEHV